MTTSQSEAGLGQLAFRKQITALYCDVVDYTSRCNALDPEDLAAELRVFQAICSSTARRFLGHVCNYLGDGILVIFGHPRANESAPRLAIRAGRELLSETENINHLGLWRYRAPFRVRIGIATGLAVVDDCGGDDYAIPIVAGQPPVLAARLQSIANPNSIVVCQCTKELTETEFLFRDYGNHKLKGYPKLVPAWGLQRQKDPANAPLYVRDGDADHSHPPLALGS